MDLTIVAVYTICDGLLISLGHPKRWIRLLDLNIFVNVFVKCCMSFRICTSKSHRDIQNGILRYRRLRATGAYQ